MTNECWDNCERFVVCARVGKRAALYIMLCDKYGRYNVAHVGRLGRGGAHYRLFNSYVCARGWREHAKCVAELRTTYMCSLCICARGNSH